MVSVLSRWARSAIFAALAVAAPCAIAAEPVNGSQKLDVGGATLEALPPQELDKGECGLFLWAKGERPLFFFVAFDNPASARIRADGRQRTLPRTQFDGDRASGHFAHQIFEDSAFKLEVDLTWDAQRPIADGALVDRGVVRITDKSGQESIVPVAGLAGCQTSTAEADKKKKN